MTHDDLRSFLADELGLDPTEIERDTLLFSSGLIDSFALVALMTHIENATGFLIPPTDVKLDNFDSIERILAYLRRVTDASEAAASFLQKA